MSKAARQDHAFVQQTCGHSLQKELKEIERDKASGVTIQLTEGSLQKLTGFVEGPKDTAYEGGYFVVDIVLGEPDRGHFTPSHAYLTV